MSICVLSTWLRACMGGLSASMCSSSSTDRTSERQYEERKAYSASIIQAFRKEFPQVWTMVADADGEQLMPKKLRSFMRSLDLPFKDTWSIELCIIKLATYLRGRVLPLDSLCVKK